MDDRARGCGCEACRAHWASPAGAEDERRIEQLTAAWLAEKAAAQKS